MITIERFGGHSSIAPLRRVMVQPPTPPTPHAEQEDAARFNYPRKPDHVKAEAEHEAFVAILEEHGVEVLRQPPAPVGELDSIFVYDPSFTVDAGIILTRPGKEARQAEVDRVAKWYHDVGIPVVGSIEEPGLLEGGDMFWVDEHTLAIGEGFRTNTAGIDQMRVYLAPFDVNIVRVELPYWNGPDECLHLMSLIHPVAEKVALAHLPLLATPFVQALQETGWTFIEISPEEFASHATNVLVIEPGKVLTVKDNVRTIQKLRDAGFEVLTYSGDELTQNRFGGATCLTRPIYRDVEALRRAG